MQETRPDPFLSFLTPFSPFKAKLNPRAGTGIEQRRAMGPPRIVDRIQALASLAKKVFRSTTSP
jgi:hypothetical protein